MQETALSRYPEYVYQIDEGHLRQGFSERDDRFLYISAERRLGSTISLQFPSGVDYPLKRPIIKDAPEGFLTKDSRIKANWENVALKYKTELKDVYFRMERMQK